MVDVGGATDSKPARHPVCELRRRLPAITAWSRPQQWRHLSALCLISSKLLAVVRVGALHERVAWHSHVLPVSIMHGEIRSIV